MRGVATQLLPPAKMMVGVGEAQQSLKLFQGRGFWLFCHHPDLFRVHSHLRTLNYVSQEAY